MKYLIKGGAHSSNAACVLLNGSTNGAVDEKPGDSKLPMLKGAADGIDSSMLLKKAGIDLVVTFSL